MGIAAHRAKAQPPLFTIVAVVLVYHLAISVLPQNFSTRTSQDTERREVLIVLFHVILLLYFVDFVVFKNILLGFGLDGSDVNKARN